MRIRTLTLLAGLALVLTAASVLYQRVGPTQLVDGEGFCPGMAPCRVPALAGGLPFPYLIDRPTVSVAGALGLGEDEFRAGAFAADALLVFGLVLVGHRLAARRPRRAAGGTRNGRL